ncbi:MAG: hypothetical protein Q7U40_04590 [Desulfatirhabdiaceae bacterium]|nr:hypothetical protein [Desulfatirhabdiaceae bacterium]
MKNFIWLTVIVSCSVEVISQIIYAADAVPVDSGTTAWMLTSTALVIDDTIVKGVPEYVLARGKNHRFPYRSRIGAGRTRPVHPWGTGLRLHAGILT